jgi:hypothetical protein
MGTQQLLLIVVGVVLIAIMIAVGLFMFRDQAAATNRDELANDLVHHAAKAQQYFRTPRSFGGGGRNFDGLTMNKITTKPSNANGTFALTPDPVTGNPPFVTITGVGTELGVDGATKVKVVMRVFSDSLYVDEAGGN